MAALDVWRPNLRWHVAGARDLSSWERASGPRRSQVRGRSDRGWTIMKRCDVNQAMHMIII